jgi:hypothetical protein
MANMKEFLTILLKNLSRPCKISKLRQERVEDYTSITVLELI